MQPWACLDFVNGFPKARNNHVLKSCLAKHIPKNIEPQNEHGLYLIHVLKGPEKIWLGNVSSDLELDVNIYRKVLSHRISMVIFPLIFWRP